LSSRAARTAFLTFCRFPSIRFPSMRVVPNEAHQQSVPLEQPSLEELDHLGYVAGHPVTIVLVLVDFQYDYLLVNDDDEVHTRERLLDAAKADVMLSPEVDTSLR
jgi:hypothetical protein